MKLFFLGNVASHYRKSIFCLMDETFDIDWYFGSALGDIKQMDTTHLKGKVCKTLIRHMGYGFYWQSGTCSSMFRKYDRYLLIGDVRAMSTWALCILALFLGKSKQVYLWTHGWYGKESAVEKYIKKIFFTLPRGGVFLYGDYAKRLMVKEGFNPKRLFVIRNSLDYPKHLSLRSQIKKTDVYTNHFGNENKVIIAIGRLNKRKRLHLLLEAVHQLNQKGIFYNVVLVGDGEEKNRLSKLVEVFGIKKQMWFYGACYDEKTNAELIFNADLCVIPGDIGLTAIHCLSFGLPCITHDNFPLQGPEFEAIKPGLTGDFFKFDNTSSLAVTIQHWLSTFKNHREVVRNACYEEIDRFWNPYVQLGILKCHLSRK